MRLFLHAAGLACGLFLFIPTANADSSSKDWTVMAFREPGAAQAAQLAQTLRKSLVAQLGPQGATRVLTDEETKLRLGVPSVGSAALIHRIGAAEDDYLQFSLDAARAKFEQGLDELASVGGEDGVWEATKTARLLLGMIHLAGQSNDATDRARLEFEAILRVAPDFKPSAQLDDPMVVALFEKARSRVTQLPRGTLRVRCTSACESAFVWVEGAPVGPVTGPALSLPAGTYRVRITDKMQGPRLRSFTHRVEVPAGGEVELEANLEIEGALELSGGPAFVLAADEQARNGASRLAARRIASGKLALVWLEGTLPSTLHVAVVDTATATVERRGFVTVPDGQIEGPCDELARFALGAQAGTKVQLAPPSLANLEQKPEASSMRILPIAKWTAVGLTAALGIAGGAVAVSANQDQALLDERRASWGGSIPLSEADKYFADQRAIDRKEGWRNGLLISSATMAAAAATLFVVDAFSDDTDPGKVSTTFDANGLGFAFSF